MREFVKHKRLMVVVCLAGAMALAACGGDDNPAGNNGANNGADVGEQDAGEQDTGAADADQPDADEQDAGDQDTGGQDGGEDDAGDQDAGADTCEFDSFPGQADLELDESANSWSLYAEVDAQMISLWIGKDAGAAGTGAVDFTDAPLADQDNALVVGNGCSSDGCDAYFMAIAGTMTITAWDMDTAGSFKAEITDVDLVEVSATATGFERVQDGQTSCVESLSLSAATDPMDAFPTEIACDRNDITTPGGSTAFPNDDGALIVEALTGEQVPQDIMSLQIYPGLTGAAISAGTYQLTDYNYATCTNCLLIYAGCDDQTCQKTFVAGEGTLEVNNAGVVGGAFTPGEPFAAGLTNAKLVEVTIDANYDTEIVEGGESWCISQYYWDGLIQDPLP